MTIDRHIRVRDLLDRRPSARELLTWYGVGLDSHALGMTLGELCRTEGLDLDDTLAELDEDYDDDEDDDDDDDGFDDDDDFAYDDDDDDAPY